MKYGSMVTRKIYYYSPPSVKNLMTSIYGFLHELKVYRSDYRQHLEFLRKAQYWPNIKIDAYRWEMMKKFIQYAYDNTLFYKRSLEHSSISPKEIKAPSDLSKLQIINKNIVNSQKYEIIPKNLAINKATWHRSSGTTGSPILFPISNRAVQVDYAYRNLAYTWANIDIFNRDRVAFCTGHPVAKITDDQPPFWSYDYLHNSLFLSSYHMSSKNIIHYIRELEKFQPKAIHGYPSSIYLLAKANKNNGSGKLLKLTVFTCSETLLDYQRKEIEDSFQTKVLDLYGNTECVARILECPEGEKHLMYSHSYVEILNEQNQPAKPGEEGRIVGTNFHNKYFPLIRYDVGDTVIVSKNQQSRCGRNGLLIDKIYGRVEDYILTPSGRKVGRLDHIFKEVSHVRNAQLVQKNVGELVIKIVKEEGYTEEDEIKIKNDAINRLGTDIRITIVYVDDIPKSVNGKYQFVVSHIKHQPA